MAKASEEAPLREELAQLRADIDSLIGTVARLADSAGDEVLSGAKRVRDRADDAYEAALAEGRRTWKSTEKTVKAHPFLSLAIAAGIGLLIGKLVAWRD